MNTAEHNIRTVLHFTPSVGGGGAEMMLCNLVKEMRGGPWRNVVVAVNTNTRGSQADTVRETADAFYDLDCHALLRPSLFRSLREIIRAEKPAVVQTWMHHADFVGGLTARSAGVKDVVWGIHTRDVWRSPGEGKIKSRLFRSALRIASHRVPRSIVSCSATALRDHEVMGYPTKKMKWIPNGISTERFIPSVEFHAETRLELGLTLDVPVIGYVGRFHHPVKDIASFFTAAAQLQSRVPAAHFVLCGGCESDLDAHAQRAFATMPHRDQVRFVPFRLDIEKLYPAFSLFTLCSRSEACPMSLLEAMSCGIPCVATDAGDSAALIERAGFTVPVGEPMALAQSWHDMLSLNNNARAEVSGEARQRVVSRFSISQTARAYQSTYDELLENS
ncbi:MAG: glycosyltransferase [Verrucomicrobiaceae bacterium]